MFISFRRTAHWFRTKGQILRAADQCVASMNSRGSNSLRDLNSRILIFKMESHHSHSGFCAGLPYDTNLGAQRHLHVYDLQAGSTKMMCSRESRPTRQRRPHRRCSQVFYETHEGRRMVESGICLTAVRPKPGSADRLL